MKVESLNNNLDRLLTFLRGDRPTYDYADVTPLRLLEHYGRVLDFYGAPRSGLSLIFLDKEDYVEFEKWVNDLPLHIFFHHTKPPTYSPDFFGIEYLGYRWTIKRNK